MNEFAFPVDPTSAPVDPSRPSRRDPAATRQKWVERIERFRTAGFTVARFCVTEGVSVPAFYQWRRTLAAEAVAEPTDGPIVVPVRPRHPDPALKSCSPLVRYSGSWSTAILNMWRLSTATYRSSCDTTAIPW